MTWRVDTPQRRKIRALNGAYENWDHALRICAGDCASDAITAINLGDLADAGILLEITHQLINTAEPERPWLGADVQFHGPDHLATHYRVWWENTPADHLSVATGISATPTEGNDE